ncbi:MAG: YncE family protein [Bacteroidia bacterium]
MKKRKYILLFSTALLLVLAISNCKYDKGTPDFNNFPDNIGKLMFTKCATSGCHTDESKGAAGGLSMESWDKLFEGGDGSACVIPYRHDYSTLFYYTNTYTDLGMALTPTMPYGHERLSREEVIMLRDWIDAGAPSREGAIKFSGPRKKFYVTNQGCDVVTVFDEATLLPMRYVNVGNDPSFSESPHMIRVSRDGKYWYVVFTAGQYIEKYSTLDDSFIGRAHIGPGSWNSFTITNDGTTAYCVSFTGTGLLSQVNLTTMTPPAFPGTGGGFNFPHGSSLNNSQDTIYISGQQSSSFYKFPTADFSGFQTVPLYNAGSPPSSSLNSHEIRFSPDGSKFFATCQGTSEVRIMQTNNDSCLAVIPVGGMPSEMSFSTSTPYVFVTCMEDTLTFPGKRGSVAIINYATNTLAGMIYAGHQPHGIEVDETNKLVYVVNRNFSTDGPAPHHSGECGGRNGNVSFIDLTTRTMLTNHAGTSIKKVEISVDPYSVAVTP